MVVRVSIVFRSAGVARARSLLQVFPDLVLGQIQSGERYVAVILSPLGDGRGTDFNRPVRFGLEARFPADLDHPLADAQGRLDRPQQGRGGDAVPVDGLEGGPAGRGHGQTFRGRLVNGRRPCPLEQPAGISQRVAVMSAPAPAHRGEVRHQPVEQKTRLVDIEAAQVNMRGEPGGQGRERADGPAGCASAV